MRQIEGGRGHDAHWKLLQVQAQACEGGSRTCQPRKGGVPPRPAGGSTHLEDSRGAHGSRSPELKLEHQMDGAVGKDRLLNVHA